MVTKRRSLDPSGRTDPGLVCLEAQALLGGLTRAWSALEAWALLGGLSRACSALEARALPGACRVLCASCSTESHCVNRE